jgi:hypothetical protein
MTQGRGITGAGFRLGALAIALALGMGGRAVGDDEIDEVMSSAGKVWYDKYCTSCHGADGAPGKAISSATKKPVDLRDYVQRHGGKFPAADWLAIIGDQRPGNIHSDVYRTIKEDQVGMRDNNVAARGVVGNIARYIRSIQTK